MANIAIFDLDETLTVHGTWGRFVVQTVKTRPWLWLPLALSAGFMQLLYKLGFVERIRVKQAMMRWSMVGKSRDEMLRRADKFAENEVENGLRPGAIKALQDHESRGDVILIISAAADILVKPIADKLGIVHWMATDMAWVNDRLAPYFASNNCYGPEKVARFQAFLADHPNVKQSDTIITFYSDSYSDIELLRFCDVGIAVNPDRKLFAEARKEAWQVVDWT